VPAAIRRRGLSHAGEIPARPPPRLGLLHGAPGLTVVERNRRDPHRHLVAVGIAQFNRFDRKLSRRGGIDDNGTDLSTHRQPEVAPARRHPVEAARSRFL
jgi:hypothetical protein